MKTPPLDQKWLWAMRHGDNLLGDPRTLGVCQPESPLIPEARAKLEKIREINLDNGRANFIYLFHSPYRRAKETAKIVFPDWDWSMRQDLAPVLKEDLDKVFSILRTEDYPQTPFDVERLIPGFCETEGSNIHKAALEMLALIKVGESALFVSHQPLLGLLRGRLDASADPNDQSLPKGGIYLFRFDAENRLLGTDVLLPPK